MIAQNATPDLPLTSIKFLNNDNSVISENTKEFMNDLTVDDIPESALTNQNNENTKSNNAFSTLD